MIKRICIRLGAATLLLHPMGTQAQQLFIDLTDGSTQSFPLEEVRSQQVDDLELSLSLWDGSSVSWDLSDIRRYRFNDISTAITAVVPDEAALSVFPNPSDGHMTIALPTAGKWTVEVLDQRGRMVHRQQVDAAAGSLTLQWHGVDAAGQRLSPGVYVCRAISSDQVLSTTLLIER